MANKPDEVVVPTGGPGLEPDVSVEDRRERLFAATVELVAKRGYRDSSLAHIIETAQVGRASFDEIYESKEDCFLAAFDRIVAESIDAVALAVAAENEWPGEMAAGLGCLLDLIVADPRRARIALVEVQAAGPLAYARYKETVDRAAPKLREGREFSKEASALPGTLEEAILGGIIWIVHQRLAKGELEDPDSLLEGTIKIALSPYLGDDEAKRLATATLQDRSRAS
ncbi:MAG TPA: TetR/AcrR family transcriptional regulator [Solirubrobacterales bacterium]|nr:TetR/AcrR family transcriptional regulator [Solirubrobacterales bacterium]